MLRGKVEGEMVLLSEGSSVKESSEDKQASAPVLGEAHLGPVPGFSGGSEYFVTPGTGTENLAMGSKPIFRVPVPVLVPPVPVPVQVPCSVNEPLKGCLHVAFFSPLFSKTIMRRLTYTIGVFVFNLILADLPTLF